MQVVISSSDPVCPVGYINFTKLHLKPKDENTLKKIYIKKSEDYLKDLYEASYTDLNDPDLTDLDLEIIKNQSKIRTSISKDDLEFERNKLNKLNEQQSQSAESICVTSSRTSSNQDKDFFHNLELYKNETKSLLNESCTIVNTKGWMWIAGVEGKGTNSIESMENAMKQLNDLVLLNNYSLNDICYITLYVRNISDYIEINSIYMNTIKYQNPPTRICVECPLPNDSNIIIEAVAHKNNENDIDFKRYSMHVQGISHWAPANIGPYSQATRIGDIIYISGQIALIPGSMKIIDGGIKQQCKLTLRHLTRIAIAMNVKGDLRKVVQGICFLTHPSFISEARRQWEKRTENAIMDYIIVPKLPRNALVEWQVWAHTHNDTFNYEETGCSIDDFTVSIRRRWNFENNVSSIVCYVSTKHESDNITNTTKLPELDIHRTSANKITANNINAIINYTLIKLLKDECHCNDIDISGIDLTNIKASIHLRVFYQVISDVPLDLLTNTLKDFRKKYSNIINLAFTVIPTCSLHNFNTFLSICGIRYE